MFSRPMKTEVCMTLLKFIAIYISRPLLHFVFSHALTNFNATDKLLNKTSILLTQFSRSLLPIEEIA